MNRFNRQSSIKEGIRRTLTCSRKTTEHSSNSTSPPTRLDRRGKEETFLEERSLLCLDPLPSIDKHWAVRQTMENSVTNSCRLSHILSMASFVCSRSYWGHLRSIDKNSIPTQVSVNIGLRRERETCATENEVSSLKIDNYSREQTTREMKMCSGMPSKTFPLFCFLLPSRSSSSIMCESYYEHPPDISLSTVSLRSHRPKNVRKLFDWTRTSHPETHVLINNVILWCKLTR